MNLTAGGHTETGPRPLNQDWWLQDPALGLWVVADGMGGHKAGEVAAHLAVEAVAAFIADSREAGDLTWPFGLDPARSFGANRLATAIRLANRRVHAESAAHAAFSGMGTTLVALLVSDQAVVVGHVGDSRAYRWRAGGLAQLTRDDSWLAAMAGIDDEASPAVARHPLRHVLTSVVGARSDVTPTIVEETPAAGDRYLLCSDGVHGVLPPDVLAEILAHPAAPDELARRLVTRALERGGADNATAVVLSVA